MLTPTVPTATEQVTTLLTAFSLTTAAHEMVPRLTQAGQLPVVPLLLEVFEPKPRRGAATHCAVAAGAPLPPGKTFETLDEGRLPPPLVRRIQELAKGEFLETRPTCSRSVCPASARVTRCVPSATP